MNRFAVGQWKVLVDQRLIVGPEGEKRLQPKVMDVLAYLARHPGEVVSRNQLIEEVWANRVVTDEVLSRSISLLRSSLGDDHHNPQYIETIAKGGYRLIAPITAEDKEADTDDGTPPKDTSKVPAIFGFAAVFIVSAVIWSFWPKSSSPDPFMPKPNALAVLPFENMSANSDNVYLSDGVSEEILNILARDNSLIVVSRTSSFVFRSDEDARNIGRQLNVAHIVDGSIRTGEDRIRITAQLIRTQDGAQIWSMSEDYLREDILDIQSDIAQAIAGQLRGVVGSQGPKDRYQTSSVEAFDAMLLGRARLQNRTVASLREAASFFQRAIELDPNYPLAYVGLADAYALIHEYGSSLSAEQMLQLAQPLLQKAVVLDPTLGEAYTSIGGLHRLRENYYDAEDAFVRAIDLSPNYATARQWYGYLLSIQMGRAEEGLVQLQKAKELDPISPIINKNLADGLNAAGRFEEAIDQYLRVMEIDPNFPGAYENLAATYRSGYGRMDESVIWLKRAIELDDENPSYTTVLSQNYLDLHDLESARQWLSVAAEVSVDENHFTSLASMYISLYLDEEDQARESALVILRIFPRHAGALEVLRILDQRRGLESEALRRIRDAYDHLLLSDNPLTVTGKDGAMELAYMLRLEGDLQSALLLETKAEEYINTHPRMGYTGYGLADARLAAIRDDHSRALSALEEAVDAGYRTRLWMLDIDPLFEAVRRQDGYQSLRSRIREDMDNMRRLADR
ncbi:MAG: tetratricopeptide repeat protein [Pseudomonadota bacterium]